jgi:hypothetical protein
VSECWFDETMMRVGCRRRYRCAGRRCVANQPQLG